jgi:2-enoate reductase
MSNYENLFSPIKIGKVEIKNRIAMMPMGVFSPRLMNHDGSYTKDGADYYIERAKGGTGLIVTGLVPIVGEGLPCIVNDVESYVKNQRYLADGCHKYGAKVFIQMTAMSGRSSTNPNHPAPSALPNVWDPTKNNREMTKEEIHQYVENFAIGAKAAKDAGIDGVEIHAVHEGYLLDQFTISNFNKRTDEYGGSLENRLRFPIEVVKAIKEKCGEDFPVSVRYSVVSKTKAFNRGALPGEEFEEYGRNMEESKKVAKMLQDAGYDMLDCDNGSYDAWFWPHPPVYMPKACNLDDVAEIKKVVDIPVICAGKFDNPSLADQSIKEGKIDMMGMGRPLLADPDLANKFKDGQEDDCRPCIGCHLGCLSRIFQVDYETRGTKDISCALNPRCGKEKQYEIKEAQSKKKVAVVGGGIAGMEAARVCALRGHQVDLYEKTNDLGGVFVAAAAFDFKSDDKRLLAWYKKQMQHKNINVLLNTEFNEDLTQNYDEIFVASGAKERKLDVEGFDNENVSYAIDTLLNKKLENQNVVVVGGGLTGIEIAYQCVLNGCKVTVVEATDVILNVKDLNASNYNMLMEIIDYYHINVLKNSQVVKYENNKAYVETTIKNYPNANGRAFTISLPGTQKVTKAIDADSVVVSVGYTSDTTLYDKIKNDHVYLIGDAVKPGNLMACIWAAYIKALEI